MKGGAENRTKTIALGVLGSLAICGVIYTLGSFFGSSGNPPPLVAPVSSAPVPARAGSRGTTTTDRTVPGSGGAVPGVNAQRLASSAASLDPTLDQAAMLRTESLVYTGAGRNIFSASYVAPAVVNLPRNVPPPRPVAQVPTLPAYTGPPPPPPIPLKFFGTAQRSGGVKQAFLLSGDDVYLASPGDIVAKRFRIGQIQPYSLTVTDLGSNNTQILPLQQ